MKPYGKRNWFSDTRTSITKSRLNGVAQQIKGNNVIVIHSLSHQTKIAMKKKFLFM